MMWDDIVNNDKYFMDLNKDGTIIKFGACTDSKEGNGGVVRIIYPFVIGAWNSHKKHLQHKYTAANIIAKNKSNTFSVKHQTSLGDFFVAKYKPKISSLDSLT